MTAATLLPLLLCAAVLVVSGAAKLRAPAATDRAFASLRVPATLDRLVVRRALPWVELVLGAALVVAPGRLLGVVATVVLVLFGAYLGLVARALAGPDPAECGCFGALGDDEVTTGTLVRNVLLVLAAAVVSGAGWTGRDAVDLLTGDPGAAVAWVLGAVLVAAVVALVVRRPAARPSATAGDDPPVTDGDYVRAPVPADLQVLDEDGELVLVRSEALLGARLLVFLGPACGPCLRVSPDLPAWATDLAPVVVTPVLLGPRASLEGHPHLRGHAWFDPHRVAHRALAPGTPSAVLVGTDGLLAGGPVAGEAEVRAFVDELREHLAEAGVSPGP